MILIEKRHWQTIISILGAFLIAGILFYFLLLRPTEERIQLLTALEHNIKIAEPIELEPAEIPKNQLVGISEKVPLARSEESIVLDLEQSALVSNTVIKSILFNYDGVPTELEDGEVGINENEEEGLVEEMYPTSAPLGLQSIMVELSIQSKDYESMLLFIQEMESVDRIYNIESFSFNGFYEEDERVGPMEDMLTYTVQLVTYYAPDIALTFDQVSAPTSEEADKTNPMHDVNEAKETSVDEETIVETTSSADSIPLDENTTVNEDANVKENQQSPALLPSQPTIKTHVVKTGETLFSISMDYYGKRNGESMIMRANNKQSNTVYVGEVLRIP